MSYRILSLLSVVMILVLFVAYNGQEETNVAPVSESDEQMTLGFWGQTLASSGGLYESSGGTTVFEDSAIIVDTLDSEGTPHPDTTGFFGLSERQSSLSDPSLEPKVGGSFNVFAVGEEADNTTAEALLLNAPANLEDSLTTIIIDTSSMDLLLKADTTSHDQCSFNGWSNSDGSFTFSDSVTWRAELPLNVIFPVNAIRANFFCSEDE